MNYKEITDDLRKGVLSPALAARAAKAIDELMTLRTLDQSEIVRLRRQIEAREGEK